MEEDQLGFLSREKLLKMKKSYAKSRKEYNEQFILVREVKTAFWAEPEFAKYPSNVHLNWQPK